MPKAVLGEFETAALERGCSIVSSDALEAEGSASPKGSHPWTPRQKSENKPSSVTRASRNGDQSTLPAGQAAARDPSGDLSGATSIVIIASGFRQS